MMTRVTPSLTFNKLPKTYITHRSVSKIMPNILITGAGFIGSFVARELVSMGERPVMFELQPKLDCISDIVDPKKINLLRGDILNEKQLVETIKHNDIDIIMHTAALLTAGVSSEPLKGIEINVLGTANVLEAARVTGVKRVIFASTGAVYTASFAAMPTTGLINEDVPIKAPPSTIYATTKALGECLGINYSNIYGVNFIALRLGGPYGPWRAIHSGGPAKIIRSIVEAIIKRVPVSLKESLSLTDYVYVIDTAHSLVLASYAKDIKSGIFNVSSGKSSGAQDLIRIVKDISPTTEVKLVKGESGYRQSPLLRDLSKSQKEFSYSPKYDLMEGIKDYIKWVKEKNIL